MSCTQCMIFKASASLSSVSCEVFSVIAVCALTFDAERSSIGRTFRLPSALTPGRRGIRKVYGQCASLLTLFDCKTWGDYAIHGHFVLK